LIYLAEESRKFYDVNDRLQINQWLMAQIGYIGPMLGQHHQFHYYNPGKSNFGEDRYFKISKRIYQELDERLAITKFLSGDNYTIADIATFPWIARHEWHDIGLINLKSSDEKINNICNDIYSNLLNENVDVLYDDKKDNPGVKFSKMDLIGLPLQMIIGNKTIETNEVEIKYRKSGEVKYIKVENLPNFVQEIKKSSAV